MAPPRAARRGARRHRGSAAGVRARTAVAAEMAEQVLVEVLARVRSHHGALLAVALVPDRPDAAQPRLARDRPRSAGTSARPVAGMVAVSGALSEPETLRPDV